MGNKEYYYDHSYTSVCYSVLYKIMHLKFVCAKVTLKIQDVNSFPQ